MLETVKFVCPECGKTWEERQDPSNVWFGYAKTKTLCDQCARQSVARVAENLRKRGLSISYK